MNIKRILSLLLIFGMILALPVVKAEAAALDDVTMKSATGHVTGNIIYWESVDGANLYQVYRLASGETSWTLLKNTGSTGYKDTSAEVGIRYYYKVRARNGNAMSSMNITSVSAIRPLANVTMAGTTPHVTGNIVRWNAVEGAKLYQVYRLQSGSTTWTLLTNTGSLAYKDTTAEVAVKYYYKVVARNGSLKSSMNITSVSAVRPLATVVMTGVQGHETGNIVRWESVFGAKLYQVYRMKSGESGWTLLANTGSLAYKDTTAEEGVRCYYKVRARNGSMMSSLDIPSLSAVRPQKAPDATALYMDFINSRKYVAEWDGCELSNLPSSYALLDIDQNGVDELILFGPATFEPWSNYMVFSCDVSSGKISQIVIDNDNPYYCYADMYYSKEHHALVFGPMSSFGGSFFREYYKIKGTSATTIGAIFTERQGSTIKYGVQLDSYNGYVSESVYQKYNNELTAIEFIPLP